MDTKSVVTVGVSFMLKDLAHEDFRRVKESLSVVRSGADPHSLLPYASLDLKEKNDYERIAKFMAGDGRNIGAPKIVVSAHTSNSWGEFSVPEDALALCQKLGLRLHVLFSTPAANV